MQYPHGFCPNCGTSVYARADEGEYAGVVAINVSFWIPIACLWLAYNSVGTNPEECQC